MAESPVLLVRRDGILHVTLNRPHAANALSPALVESLLEALVTTRNIRLCVIRGQGKHFCAGFDLSDLDDLSDGDLLWRFLRIEMLLQTIYHAPYPTLALAHGQVVGAGADMFAACWQRIAAPHAKFRMPGWNFELALGTRRLAHLIGEDAARDLLIDTRVITAEEAVPIKLVSEIVPQDSWSQKVIVLNKRASALPYRALHDLFRTTERDTRDADLASVVKTAGVPGLKQRILAYRDRVKATKSP